MSLHRGIDRKNLLKNLFWPLLCAIAILLTLQMASICFYIIDFHYLLLIMWLLFTDMSSFHWSTRCSFDHSQVSFCIKLEKKKLITSEFYTFWLLALTVFLSKNCFWTILLFCFVQQSGLTLYQNYFGPFSSIFPGHIYSRQGKYRPTSILLTRMTVLLSSPLFVHWICVAFVA